MEGGKNLWATCIDHFCRVLDWARPKQDTQVVAQAGQPGMTQLTPQTRQTNATCHLGHGVCLPIWFSQKEVLLGSRGSRMGRGQPVVSLPRTGNSLNFPECTAKGIPRNPNHHWTLCNKETVQPHSHHPQL
jgi:hypothetical protein